MTDNNRVVVLLSGSGTTLQAILDQQNQYSYQVVGVLSNRPEAYGLERALHAGVDTQCLDHKLYSSREQFDLELMEHIDRYNPDLIVLAGYMRILSSAFVEHYQGKLINIHPSLLPKHKGLNTYQSALDAGDKEHGTSVHFVTEELDSGSVVMQAALEITPSDTAKTLEQRVKVMEHHLYPKAIDWIVSGRIDIKDDVISLDNKPLGPQGYRIAEQNIVTEH
ncbi:phosphoribosylglycinamide formyltransferase [Endozoicomonas numazuensis]|uniref:Phosphoribosylglycinamide formyltransferase n=1 Tax=Endozoicomonas numazuensis TaxID=1137799 RepID=A0A081NE58_9GAMM|nr:phosphoribosylglycinamide formyltransferase [Endozoicomonas numazuensis]KEQ16731.1 phosphoribosylglycinamide formyltransferase [Endozoicomonas numazuensis]